MLTDEKKNKIKELRADGYGYKTISILISETRDSVRSYCRKIGMTGKTATKNVRSIPQSDHDVYRKIKEATGAKYEYIGGYINADNKIKIKCKKCGHEFSGYYRDVIYKGVGCPRCKNAIKNLEKERQSIEKYSSYPENMKKFGIEFAAKQCQELIKNNVDGLHFFTLNKAESSIAILNNIL